MKYNPYSVSRIQTYQQCPKKFQYAYVEKVLIEKEPQKALILGSYIHQIIENNFNYKIPMDIIPGIIEEKDILYAQKVVKNLEKEGIFSRLILNSIKEEPFGIKVLNKRIILTPFNDKQAWIRGSIDLYSIKNNKGIIIDWKSGKDKSKDKEFGKLQSKIYALYLFLKYPELDIIDSYFIFVEHITKIKHTYIRKELKNIIKEIYILTKNIENTKIFPEKVSALCDYCDFKNICKGPTKQDNLLENILNTKIIF